MKNNCIFTFSIVVDLQEIVQKDIVWVIRGTSSKPGSPESKCNAQPYSGWMTLETLPSSIHSIMDIG